MSSPDHPLEALIRPAGSATTRWIAATVVSLLILSAVLVVVAANTMPAGYSWRVHSISESAAQGQNEAWIARLAFLCFGFAVLVLSLAVRRCWARVTYWMNLAFSIFMIGAAAFSHKPWTPGIPYDQFEDVLHSFCASGMGFAFSIGVVARFAQRGTHDPLGRSLDVLVLILAIVTPLILASSSGWGGLMQRIMFVAAYVWFGREALMAFGWVKDQNDA